MLMNAAVFATTFSLIIVSLGCSSDKSFKSSVGSKSAEQAPAPETSPSQTDSAPKDPQTPSLPQVDPVSPMMKERKIDFVVTFEDRTVVKDIKWIPENRFAGYILIYNSKNWSSWRPKNGEAYTAGSLGGDDEILFVGTEIDFQKQLLNLKNRLLKDEYHFFTLLGFDSQFRYSGVTGYGVGRSASGN